MSAYAILGATGQVGSSILQLLSSSPKTHINVLVRSRSKLNTSFPHLSTNPQIRVFEGSISDAPTLSQCLANTKVAFLAVATTDNKPGVSISLDTAHAVVSALQGLRHEDPGFKPPRLIVLSSASLDAKFWRGVPEFVHKVMYAANFYIYEDLARAEEYLREQGDWLDVVFVMPGGLTHDVQRGHKLSTEKQQTFISFLDLAGGMIEVGDAEGGRREGGHVSVVLREGRWARFEWWAPVVLAKGLLCYLFPWL